MELTINDQVYVFFFGIGFAREINKTAVQKSNGLTKEMGLNVKVAGLIDGDVCDLVDILDLANRGQTPRVTRALLESYIDDPDTDIDHLFEVTLDFLKRSNACKKQVKNLLDQVERLQK